MGRFYLLESLILDHKCQNGYDYEKHTKYAAVLVSIESKTSEIESGLMA
jgi:hypothetical protein